VAGTLSGRPSVRVGHLVAAAILVLPLVPYAYLHAPVASSAIRYAVEAVVDAAAVIALALRWRVVVRRLAPVLVVLTVLVGYWLFTDVWNAVSIRTPAAALLGDLRFVPVVVLVASAVAPLRDAELYLRAILVAAGIQAVLALLAAAHATSLQTTLHDRNQLGVFLMLACLVLAASYEQLGRRNALPLAVLLLAGVGAAASREGALGLLAGVVVLAFLRAGRRGRVAVAAAAAVCAIALLLPTISGSGSGVLDSRSVAVRWQQLFSANLSPSTNFRTRLLSNNAKLVAREEPLFGMGFGTASAPAVVGDLSSPVYRSFVGFDLASQVEPFVYDSFSATIVLETGFVGVAVLVSVLAYLWLLGLRARDRWFGRAVTASVPAVAVACFAGPALREPMVSLVLWLLVALTAVFLRQERGAGVPVAAHG
jgi:hypothetical protein